MTKKFSPIRMQIFRTFYLLTFFFADYYYYYYSLFKLTVYMSVVTKRTARFNMTASGPISRCSRDLRSSGILRNVQW